MKRLYFLVAGLGLIACVGGLWYARTSGREVPVYKTVPAQRGDLTAAISATGTLEPEEVVDVGAQVAGMVLRFGPDPRDSGKTIDYGSPVEPGTVLAQIDDALYQAQVEQARANVQKAEADALTYQAKYDQADRDWARVRQLGPSKGVVSGIDYDAALATYLSAKAAIALGQASLAQANATLRQAEISLGYTTIRSPVKGVIVDRRVNVGQTVVASLNAPSLFLIAKDLRRMQIWASVNEADIGQIRPGQPVNFNVDAYPGETFKGEVAQVRLNATMTQNVVTYTVVVNFDNSSGKLLPYLTANVSFEVDRCSQALVVPNGALRWQPQRDQVAPDARRGPADTRGHTAVVWVQDEAFVRPVRVELGLTDGSVTEITGGDLKEGMPVVTGVIQVKEGDAGAASPFAPKMFSGKKGT